MKTILLLAFLACLVTNMTCDVFISRYGSDRTGDGSKQAPFFSLSKALSVSQEHDTIYADVGVYTKPENFPTIEKSVSIISTKLSSTPSSNDPSEQLAVFDGFMTTDTWKVNAAIYVEGVEFTSDDAKKGTALQILDNGKVEMKGCRFVNKNLAFDVRGQMSEQNQLVVKNSEFHQVNYIQNSDSPASQFVNCKFSSITYAWKVATKSILIDSCSFEQTKSIDLRGAQFEIANCQFDDISISVSQESNGIIHDCVFKGQVRPSITTSGGKVTIKDTTFSGTVAGAITGTSTEISMDNININDCQCTVMNFDTCDVTMNKVTISGMRTTSDCTNTNSAIIVSSSNFTATQSDFFDNQLTDYSVTGGAVLSMTDRTDAEFSFCKFNNNQAITTATNGQTLGGAVYMKQSTARFMNTTFVGNIAANTKSRQSQSVGGGAIYASTGSTVIMSGGSFDSNHATLSYDPSSKQSKELKHAPRAFLSQYVGGGAVYLNTQSTFDGRSITITKNQAIGGQGGVFCMAHSAFNLQMSLVENNLASVGAVGQCEASSVRFYGNTIQSNTEEKPGSCEF